MNGARLHDASVPRPHGDQTAITSSRLEHAPGTQPRPDRHATSPNRDPIRPWAGEVACRRCGGCVPSRPRRAMARRLVASGDASRRVRCFQQWQPFVHGPYVMSMGRVEHGFDAVVVELTARTGPWAGARLPRSGPPTTPPSAVVRGLPRRCWPKPCSAPTPPRGRWRARWPARSTAIPMRAAGSTWRPGICSADGRGCPWSISSAGTVEATARRCTARSAVTTRCAWPSGRSNCSPTATTACR